MFESEITASRLSQAGRPLHSPWWTARLPPLATGEARQIEHDKTSGIPRAGWRSRNQFVGSDFSRRGQAVRRKSSPGIVQFDFVFSALFKDPAIKTEVSQ